MKRGKHSGQVLRQIRPVVKKILALQPAMQKLSNTELKSKTKEFKNRLQNGESLDSILPEAYAVVREADKRVLGMEPYPVQIIGGIILHQGRIAELRTGEGKSLMCTMPSYLHALEGKGCIVVTVNDYLASRDAEEMGQVHQFLGLSCTCITQDMGPAERRAAYANDITYITNNELGFDYLRDNMVLNENQKVQRGLHYCIIDEIDSVLIDEARTPLIISNPGEEKTNIYHQCDLFVKFLTEGKSSGEFTKAGAIMGEEITETGDFIVNEKEKNVHLTKDGIRKAEQFFGIRNLSDPEHAGLQHNIGIALKANYIMKRDKDYVVRGNEILIVDDFTGRIMPGRRYSDGIHQAIEAKEHVEIKQASQTMATITFQNFFNKFDKKCGMTGTAATEEQEFIDIYNMDVITVPTNRPVLRKDEHDLVYKTKKEKYNAIIEEVKKAYDAHRPVLVGTPDIHTSEKLSQLLLREEIPHRVLNAKNDEEEAFIVSKAGHANAVTIATDMAGRGTDIKLDAKAKEAGGLLVLGAERHESKRIDNQLIGRSGRQGDPGESRFYISLEDNLLRLFGAENLVKLFTALNIPENTPIHHHALTKAIEGAQHKIEGNHFEMRKQLLDYDRTNNDQREIIYAERNKILAGENMKQQIEYIIEAAVHNAIDEAIPKRLRNKPKKWNLDDINSKLQEIGPFEKFTAENIKHKDIKAFKKFATEQAIKNYNRKEETFVEEFGNAEHLRDIERLVLLRLIDKYWMQHLTAMEHLKQNIGLTAYAQHDPKIEYRIQGFDLFHDMAKHIQHDTAETLSRVSIYLFKQQTQQSVRIINA